MSTKDFLKGKAITIIPYCKGRKAKAATGSPPWAAPGALISMCGKVGLEGTFSL